MILKGPEEVIKAAEELRAYNFIQNEACPPKDWDLLLALSAIGQHANGKADVLDMGCQGSIVLHNLLNKVEGKKVGIDFVQLPPFDGIDFLVGDITNTGIESESFDFITCLSVLEHGVDGYKFFKECSRLLRPGGRLLLSYDYWDPKLRTTTTVFGLPWCVFCKQESEVIIGIAKQYGLEVEGNLDWGVGKPVIYPGYFSPCDVSYTFCYLSFRKSE